MIGLKRYRVVDLDSWRRALLVEPELFRVYVRVHTVAIASLLLLLDLPHTRLRALALVVVIFPRIDVRRRKAERTTEQRPLNP